MYKPHQRQVAVDILTAAGWVSGVMHVPAKTSLTAALNKRTQFVPLTHVNEGESPDSPTFLALRRESIIAVVPREAEKDEHAYVAPGLLDRAGMRCLLADGCVEGTASVLGGQRLSDFLETNAGFVPLCAATVVIGSEDARTGMPLVILNLSHVLAVTEVEPAPSSDTAPPREAVAAR